MKKRYVQFQKDRVRLFTNELPDHKLGPVIEVSDKDWEQLYKRPVHEWTVADGKVVSRYGVGKIARTYKWAILMAAVAAAAGIGLFL